LPVVYETVTPRDVPVELAFTGRSTGSREVEIRARVSGIVARRLDAEGSKVQPGQPLFRLEPALYEAAEAKARASEATAAAMLRQAERELRRATALLAEHMVSQQAADLAAEKAELARAALQAAQAETRTARINLQYTRVDAPIGGIVGRALKETGSLANAQGDSLLATMAVTDPIYVNFGLSESERQLVTGGAAQGGLRAPPGGYRVRLADANGQPLDESGRLDFQDYRVDPSSGTYTMRASVANPAGRIAPGAFVRVTLSGGVYPQAVVVPQAAVLDGPAGKFVYVVAAGKNGRPEAAQRPVAAGPWTGDGGANGWLIRHGLRAGDQVVTDGVARISGEHAPLAPRPAKQGA
jgi:membrane fusion protein (multidrug efflux system)